MSTKFYRKQVFKVVLGSLGLSGCFSDAFANTFTEALVGGKAKLDIRLRYESVDQNNALQDAQAPTLRTRLGYATDDYLGWSAYGEFEDVTVVGDDDYNLPPDTPKTYSVVADPEGSEVNQLFLRYKGIQDSLLTYGRQRIILDNARFVGNVGWRQNEQTYDGIHFSSTALADTKFTYAYLYNINTILATETDTKTHLVNASYSGLAFGSITGYGYFVEFPDASANSSKTLGLRFAGKSDFDGWSLLYAAEFAKQSDYKDGNSSIDGDYSLLELGVRVGGLTAKLGHEVLGEDQYGSFETPLATKHAFNGWTDQFLNTPDGMGLQDTYVLATGSVFDIKLLAIYHQFEADSDGTDFGDEWGLLAVKKFNKHYSAGIKFASYDADTFSVDTDKLWIWFGLQF